MSGDGNTPGAAPELGAAWWAGGLTLAERLDRTGGDIPTGRSPESVGETARWRLREWRNAHGLLESGQFDRRLAAAGLTVDELASLLDEEPTALAGRTARPDWAVQAAESIATARPTPAPRAEAVARADRMPAEAVAHADGTPAEAVAHADGMLAEAIAPAGGTPAEAIAFAGGMSAGEGFATIVAPFAEGALRRLGDALDVCGPTVRADALLAAWSTELRQQLVAPASRTLVLELNVMRVSRRLEGATPEERFADFVRWFGRPEALAALCEEYPVLARLLAQTADRFAVGRIEMLTRYAEDRPDVVRTLLGGTDPGPLTAVEGGGDTHQGGRAVSVLTFESGARVVYKPRPQAVHRHFNDALAWLDERVAGLDLVRLAVLDRGPYGWVEFAPHLPCRDREEVARYYHRLGALLALLHALDGADFHCENLIASGDQPVLVDLEALLHPLVPGAGIERLMEDPAALALESSVSRSGLLPELMVGEDGVIDLSGMGGDKDAVLPMKTPAWAGQGTDEMRLVRENMVFPGVRNRPRLGEDAADPADHLDDLLAGFGAGYEAIVADAPALVRLMTTFSGDEVRVVPRATRTYGKLMMESTHPDVLRHGLDRDRVLDHLWAITQGDRTRERLIAHEAEDLWAGDIPIFTTRPGSRDLWSSGGVRIPDALPEPSLSRAVRKVLCMGREDRARQEWIIRASMVTRDRSGLAALATDTTPPAQAPVPATVPVPVPVPVPATVQPDKAHLIASASATVQLDEPRLIASASQVVQPDEARLIAAARDVADLIDRQTCSSGPGGRVNWLGLELIDEKYWRSQPLSWDLYGGYPGVALFLAQCASVTGEERYADLARRAVVPLARLADDPPEEGVMGAFTGLGGVAYALTHLAVLLDDPVLARPVEDLVESCAKAAGQDEALDVIVGGAGTLATMLAIHRATGSPAASRAAEACAERLLATAVPTGAGVAWHTPMSDDRPLTGFSHGAGGIGWALRRYAEAGGDPRARDTALAAFAYESEHYRPDLRGWPDYRQGQGGDDMLHAWCHGAPGIGLSRTGGPPPEYLDLDQNLSRDRDRDRDRDLDRDIDRALAAELARGPMANHSLCHGELGNLELLVRLRHRPEAAELLTARTAHLLDDLARHGPRCGAPGAAPTPGLMNGLAGIGYGLLRLARPEHVPSVLLLDAPAGGER
ncbi:type 2 lanthipeptide synthetase LanM family protein [Streptosporangium sp. V21-05]|uniref:type 2 lanthipeptide synthetase LanM family protein n=1 Tax=Streptosporangium sp. V21-05 TaxID=3446115 RepID=UPI003F53DBBB